jgi:hypothetical protein
MQKVPCNNEHQHSIEREHAFGWRVYFYILFICQHKQQQQQQPVPTIFTFIDDAVISLKGSKRTMENGKEIDKTLQKKIIQDEAGNSKLAERHGLAPTRRKGGCIWEPCLCHRCQQGTCLVFWV